MTTRLGGIHPSMMSWWLVLCVAGLSAASAPPCGPGLAGDVPKAPGDNFYRLVINGDVDRYAPNQRYVVTLVGSRTHSVVQQFTRFKLVLDPLDPETARSPKRQGQFQLFADTLSKFDENCTNSVLEADDLPKTEVQVMWMAPPPGSGCVLLKAMVMEASGAWYAEDGQLSRRVCEDTSRPTRDCCACDHAKYKMVFEGIWSAQTHPKDFPVKAQWLTHFSDVMGATHVSNFSFWGEGHIATDGFRSLAEWGSVDLLERELRERGSGTVRTVLRAPGLWYPRVNQNTTTTFYVDPDKHLLSFATMFGPSPDWVVGVSGLELCNADCTWTETKVVDLTPWDAGTDSGISYMSPNVPTAPPEHMYRITGMFPEDPRAPFYAPHRPEVAPLARVYITRDSLVHRGCDERVLEAIVAGVDEEDQDTPQCAVSEWSVWSPCSVSCGKGLRTRSRTYLPGADEECRRLLVQKEMCAAKVPECPPDGEPDPSELSINAPVEDVGGLCETGEWSSWSECSVTCGIGVRTRRRTFINHMGYKKCPLVQIEENQKCMEPQCTSPETDVSDPGCPTTPWSGWSPCSTSCGRGSSLRTRLLLVAPEQQVTCSSKVELVQQRPCQERESCEIDMVQAKQICMLEPEVGPCRGVYSRWRFAALKGMCVPFSYGGCRGNRNNFLTRGDCEDTCLRISRGGTPSQSNSPGLSVDSSPSQPTVDVGASETSSDCEVSGWGEWSRCSVSCGLGFQERTRTIIREAGPGGAPCPLRMSRKRRCHRPC